MIDRSKLETEPLKNPLIFDNSLTRCEDYDFLLKMASRYDFDFTYLKTPICEYRFRRDDSNTTILPLNPSSNQATQLWDHAIQEINQRKRNLSVRVNMHELSELREQLKQVTNQRSALEAELHQIEHVIARRIRSFLTKIPALKFVFQKSLQLLRR
jgi:predicted  nucleic acid-binding Zn-ribbon protein